ncbi:hypothetical protein G6F62_015152 [Rhizopus arrhizus]|nr:hypothetical protein G6F62_015152 [Rhizopus arrhizus]
MPIRPPRPISSTDSTITRVSTVLSLKPSVFSVASSGTRSRTACAMVLPVSSSRVKNTAPMIEVTIMPMSANCLTKACWNADSVWVLVSWSELAEIASMACATREEWSGLSSVTVYQLTWVVM